MSSKDLAAKTYSKELQSILAFHRGGKIHLESNLKGLDRETLSKTYTPGVADVCQLIAKDPALAYDYTIKQNTVAIVTDGSAVLGLGNIGPLAALPVMEGKALLLKHFAGVDAFPICLQTQNPDEIINIVQNIAPSFGAINLEDIAAPHCFEIETALKDRLDIPVFHDDQHGTAIVTVAALINALTLVKKTMQKVKIVINGAGAAGLACAKLLLAFGAKNIVVCDRHGAIFADRSHLNSEKHKIALVTNKTNVSGPLQEAIRYADVFIGVSSGNVLTKADLLAMAPQPIVFAMANPTPEIMPEIAKDHVAIMATGRSDYPNQINNVLAFPGIFRGVLDARATSITKNMYVAAAKALAECVPPSKLKPNHIVPSVFDRGVVQKIAKAVVDCM